MKNFIVSIIWLLITGCSGMKGGPCEYQSINGIATIVESDANTTAAVFQPEPQAKESLLLRKGDLYYLHQRVNGPIGSRYPASMSVITEGSCTPLQLKITGDEILGSKK